MENAIHFWTTCLLFGQGVYHLNNDYTIWTGLVPVWWKFIPFEQRLCHFRKAYNIYWQVSYHLSKIHTICPRLVSFWATFLPFRQRLIAFGQRLYNMANVYTIWRPLILFMRYIIQVTLRHFTQCLPYEWINAYSIWVTLVLCEHRVYDLGNYFSK